VLQCVAVCCSVCTSANSCKNSVSQRVAVCCSVWQRVAMCCCMLLYVAVYAPQLISAGTVCYSVLQCVQRVAASCSELQCVAVCCSVYTSVDSCRKLICVCTCAARAYVRVLVRVFLYDSENAAIAGWAHEPIPPDMVLRLQDV